MSRDYITSDKKYDTRLAAWILGLGWFLSKYLLFFKNAKAQQKNAKLLLERKVSLCVNPFLYLIIYFIDR